MTGLAFVEAKRSVFPSTRPFSYSRGELPRSKPFTFTPSRSPQRSRSLTPIVWARRIASSTVSTGITFAAPFRRAVPIVEQLRRTSTTTSCLFSRGARPASRGVTCRSIRPIVRGHGAANTGFA
jgi:hypothetical protein